MFSFAMVGAIIAILGVVFFLIELRTPRHEYRHENLGSIALATVIAALVAITSFGLAI